MEFLKPEFLKWTAAVIVPGFIAMRVYDLLVPAKQRDWSKSLLELLVYGGLNFAIWFWLVDYLTAAAQMRKWWFGLAALGVLGLSPALLGSITVWIRNWAGRRGLWLHPFPTAWDAFFSRRNECWVVLHLKDGRRVGGHYGDGSFASAFPNDRDLYIREAWSISDDGRFSERVVDSLGVWISAKDCDLIEFLESGREETNDDEGEADKGRSP